MYIVSPFLQLFQHMMAQSTVLVAALLISTLSYSSAENVYCVTPTATSCSSCPHNSTNCATLSEYAQEAETYFTSNTTMVFLPGDHVLNTSITVANVASLTMRGESSSGNRTTIICNGPVGFSFTSMVEFKIQSLAFTSCNRSSSGNDRVASLANSSALFLYSTPSAELVNCSFHDNFCTALAVFNTDITLAENKFTHNQCACDTCGFAHGCGITAYNSNLTFTGNTAFLENSYSSLVSWDAVLAGAIWAVESSLHFNGTNNFIGNVNSAQSMLGGGAIYATSGSFLSFTGVSNFSNNSAHSGAGAIYAYPALVGSTSVSFNGTSIFVNNSGDSAGAIYAQYNVVFSFIGRSIFSGNSACSSGGGGAIYALTDTSFSFTGDTTFSNSFGGAISAASNTSVSFNGTTNLSANLGGAIYTSDNSLVSFRGTSNMDNNFMELGGAIYASDTTLMFEGTIHFTNNGNDKYISKGGGMYLSNSVLSILPNTTVYWANNHATYGGAIYVDDLNPFIYCTKIEKCAPKECFFQLPGQNLSNGLDVQLVFENNSADAAGSVLYGGAVDNCRLTHGLDSYSSGEVFDMIVHIDDDNTTSSISSEPFRICQCENNLPNCRKSCVPKTVYPGETFTVSVVAVGQGNGTVATQIGSTIDGDATLLSSQYTQQANNTCTTLNYTVFSLSDSVLLQLYANFPCSTFSYTLNISLSINQTCPPGFKISKLTRSCICEQRLQRYTNSCNITSRKITRDSLQQFWVGYDNQSDGLILHPHCPFDYCANYTVDFSLNETDKQCAHNRAGLLCGACSKEGYSLVLGTSHCRLCTNSHIALLIPFAVMGVALVFLLLVCKLTVATGTLSGLVFYANIVGVNRDIFLPGESTGALSVFIAWLNLDFGIETCFFDGMDTYSKTWLQFVFPVYIWVLVGLMILVSYFSQRFAKLLGNNPVSVLATLILLSYTKILRTLITAIYITYLEYPTYNRMVWLYDANIDYLSGKHIPLFIVAVLVFLFLFLPYTLLLLIGQWLQAISHLRIFLWVNNTRLKPFLDSYHAPYKAKHRYWPGLLLVLRFVLLLVFAFNPQQDPSINLLVILVGAGMLHMWAWVSGGVYRNWCVDALESSFMLNLIILAAATYHVEHSGGNQLAVWCTSVSIALLSFIAILAYHIFQRVRHTKLCKNIPKPKFNKQNFNDSQDVNNSESLTNKAISVTVTEVGHFDELREPLLEDEPHPHHYTA